MKKSLFASFVIHASIITAAVILAMSVSVEKEAEPIRISVLSHLPAPAAPGMKSPAPAPEAIVTPAVSTQPLPKARGVPTAPVRAAESSSEPLLNKAEETAVPSRTVPALPVAPVPVEEPPSTKEAVSPKPAAKPRKADPALREAYFQYLRETIDERKVYPRIAERMRQSGTVMIRFTLQNDGTVGNVFVVSSSGFSLLDRAALELLASIAKVRPIPKELGDEPMVVTFPVEYALR